MKRKLAALLCAVMCVGAFSGCSTEELGYLKMAKDMADTMEVCKIEGTMQADVDFDAMESFVVDVAKATDPDTVAMVGEFPEGKQTLKIDYDMNMDMNAMKYDMSFDVDYAGKAYDLGTIYYSMKDGIVMTTDTLWGFYQLAGAVAEKSDDYSFTEAYAKDLKAILGQDKYIRLISAEDMTGIALEETGDDVVLYDAVMTFYTDALKGFETGMVKKIDGGYAIQANGQDVAQLVIKLLDFIGKNPTQVLDATETYLMTVMGAAGATAEEKAEIQKSVAALKASEKEFIEAAGLMSTAVAELVTEDHIAMLLDSFRYEGQVKKTTTGFRSTDLIYVTYKEKQVVKITTDSSVTKSTKTVTIPTGGIALEKLQGDLEKLEDKYNPIVGVEATWGWDDTSALLQPVRKDRNGFGGADQTTVLVKNGRAYLPLRTICDTLGETVVWDKTEKKAYVVKNDRKIAMNGWLEGSSTFVGVRDFEKLGYTVSYKSEYGLKTATINK